MLQSLIRLIDSFEDFTAASGSQTVSDHITIDDSDEDSDFEPKKDIKKVEKKTAGLLNKADSLRDSNRANLLTTSTFKPFTPCKAIETPNKLSLEDLKFNMIDSATEDRFIEQIYKGCLMPKLKLSWDDIGGLEPVKASMKEVVVYPLLRPDIFRGLRSSPKGVLLYGPPGTGKTMIAQCIASECNSNFFNVSASSLTSKWVGDAEKTVQALFAVARAMQPSVIFIDEADSILTKRTEKEQESAKKLKTEMMIQMDGAATDDTDNVLVIAATNRPSELDEAVRRRFTKRFLIPLPDYQGRLQILSKILRKEETCISDQDLQSLAKRVEGYSGADLKKVCKEAAMIPIRECPDILHVDLSEVRLMSTEDVMKAIEKIKPSVSTKDLTHYREFDKLFGDKP